MGTKDLVSVPAQPESNSSYGSRKNDEQKITGEQEKSTDVKDRVEERQNEVYLLRLRGHSNKEIAEKLQVSLSTVEKDLHEIKSNVIKAYKNFQQAGIFEVFQDACAQIDLIQAELWQKYVKFSGGYKLKILQLLQNNATKKLEIYKLGLSNSPLLDRIEKSKSTSKT